ncbi:MAG: tRNA lysidine(34) synthetase TilS [Treponema sp.]|nr:tRNA lysidine(34) synthetase TilS [Treponema sp.]
MTKNLKSNPRAFKPDLFEAAVFAGLEPWLKTGGRALLALSGGADSTAMAAALSSLRDAGTSGSGAGKAALSLYALHVNHGIRGAEECAADAEAVSALCASLHIPLAVASAPPGAIAAYARRYGTGVEAAARRFRRRFLREEAQKIGAAGIFTAHTAGDRLETILMALLRGSGPAGIGALSGSSVRTNGGFPVQRPLLSLTRAEVLGYLEARNIPYRSDPSNMDGRFFRNRIRLTLIPFLDGFFPRWREPLGRLGETQAMTAAFLSGEAAERLPWTETDAGLSLPGERFFSQPEILREEALFRALDCLAAKTRGEGDKNPRRDVLRSFVRGAVKAADLGKYRLVHSRGSVSLKRKPPHERGFSVLIKSPGVYKLEALTLTAFEEPVPVKPPFPGKGSLQDTAGFFAGLPLAVYERRGKIIAEDRQGKAAQMTRQGLVWKRTSPVFAGTGMAYITVIPGEG